MVDVRKYYTPTPLRGEDLMGNPTEVTIRSVGEFDDWKKLPVHFTDGRSINASGRNLDQLANATGSYETNDWQGHTVVLVGYKFNGTDRETGQQKEMFAINVKRSDNNTKEKINSTRAELKDAIAAQPQRDELNDEIPF